MPSENHSHSKSRLPILPAWVRLATTENHWRVSWGNVNWRCHTPCKMADAEQVPPRLPSWARYKVRFAPTLPCSGTDGPCLVAFLLVISPLSEKQTLLKKKPCTQAGVSGARSHEASNTVKQAGTSMYLAPRHRRHCLLLLVPHLLG